MANGSDAASLELIQKVAAQALALTVQNWIELGQGTDPATILSTDLEVCVDRVTALMTIRLVGIAVAENNFYANLATSGLCRKILIENELWPKRLTERVMQQIRQFVTFIMEHYNPLPFHNFQHACQVVVSANKLMDLMLALDSNDFLDDTPPPAFGLRHDPIALQGLIFAALVHDVDHQGTSNRQLVAEEHPLALIYNDTSIGEQRSLHLAFDELLKDDYQELRSVMFPESGDYRYFRMIVVSAVLSTDIANPERAQISKSKWKEAFAEDDNRDYMIAQHLRRGSLMSDISNPRVQATRHAHHKSNRRGSNGSVLSCVSDVTMDSYTKLLKSRQRQHLVEHVPRQVTDSDFPVDSYHQHHKCPSSGVPAEESYSDFSGSPVHPKECMIDSFISPRKEKNQSRRHSMQSMNTPNSSTDSYGSIAQESIDLARKRQDGQAKTRRRNMAALPRITSHNDESNSSISLTPPSSDDEKDKAPVRGVMVTKSDSRFAFSRPSVLIRNQRTSRRASTGGNVPVRFGSLAGQRIDEDAEHNASFGKLSGPMAMDRRVEPERHRRRLSILRGMDFSGEPIEIYQRFSIGGTSLVDTSYEEEFYLDQPDALKASVLLELILRAADVGHCLQNWDNMARWSSLLFKELAAAYNAGRGHNPGPSWFDNQAKALESYVLPLSQQLDDIGVFGEFIGAVFAQQLEDNRDHWLIEGFELTLSLREESGL